MVLLLGTTSISLQKLKLQTTNTSQVRFDISYLLSSNSEYGSFLVSSLGHVPCTLRCLQLWGWSLKVSSSRVSIGPYFKNRNSLLQGCLISHLSLLCRPATLAHAWRITLILQPPPWDWITARYWIPFQPLTTRAVRLGDPRWLLKPRRIACTIFSSGWSLITVLSSLHDWIYETVHTNNINLLGICLVVSS